MTSYFDPELLEVMPDVITVEPYNGLDAWGNPQYGVPVSGVRVNWEPTVVRGVPVGKDAKIGDTPYSQGTLYAQPAALKPRDKVTLPDGDVVYIVEVINWRNVPEAGEHHQQATYKEEA